MTLVGQFLADGWDIADILCHSGVSAEFGEISRDIAQLDAGMHGSHTIGGMEMHDHPDIMGMLSHPALQAEVQGKFATGSEIGTDVRVRYHHRLIKHTDLLELIGLQGLFTHTRGSDIEVISVMMPDADVTIATGDPIATVSLDHGVTYGFEHFTSALSRWP